MDKETPLACSEHGSAPYGAPGFSFRRSRREPLVKHQINQHTGQRYVKPDWHCPAAEAAMSIPATLENRDERNDYQRQGNERKQHVRNQNRKIDRRDPAGVTGGFFAHVRVINDVSNEKQGRADDGGDHARDMSLPDIAPDPEPAGGNENCAQGIERSIDCGKIGD